MKEANYSNGDYYHYSYDAVGNRLTQETLIGSVPLTTNYVYDAANRLTSVDSVAYTWDNNGNLLNDGVNTYTYDSANRLKTLSNQSTVSSYQYNGLGDRLTQIVNGNTTNYTLDLNTGLTQVLNDGTNQYLYGVGRIAQVNTTTEYFLGDALGSVRQLTNANGVITLAKSYQPYGEVLASVGNGTSPFAFTGEQQDVSGLTYLRARYYSSGDGRFLTRDTWGGDFGQPHTMNRWNYVSSNPITYIDPSGNIREDANEAEEALDIVQELQKYQINIVVDWGYVDKNSGALIGVLPLSPESLQLYLNLYGSTCGEWEEGKWALNELMIIKGAVLNLNAALNNQINKHIGTTYITKVDNTCGRGCALGNQIQLLDSQKVPSQSPASDDLSAYYIRDKSINFDQWTVVHELGHIWDNKKYGALSLWLMASTGGSYDLIGLRKMNGQCDDQGRLRGCNDSGYVYGGIPPAGSGTSFNHREDFAESVAAYVFSSQAHSKMIEFLNNETTRNSGYFPVYFNLFYYTDYTTTERWKFIDNLVK